MPLKVTITVSVQDAEHTSYKDPSGSADVELYCIETSEIETAANSIAGALVKVASVKYQAEVVEKEIEGG